MGTIVDTSKVMRRFGRRRYRFNLSRSQVLLGIVVGLLSSSYIYTPIIIEQQRKLGEQSEQKETSKQEQPSDR